MVAVGDNGPVWATAENSDVYRRVGISNADFEGTAWELVSPNSLKQVSVGTCQVWGVNVWHEVFRRRGLTQENTLGESWEQHQGQLMEISVGYGPVLWGVDEAHNAWFKQLGEVTEWPDQKDLDEHWIHVPGVHLKQLDFGKDGQVWGMASSNVVYFREGVTVEDKDGTNWRVVEDNDVSLEQRPGHVTICATGNHAVWATSESDATQLLFRNGVRDGDRVGLGWETVTAPAAMEQISCGANMQLWGVSSDGRTWII